MWQPINMAKLKGLKTQPHLPHNQQIIQRKMQNTFLVNEHKIVDRLPL